MKKRISIHLQPPVFYLALIPLISFLIITSWRLACNSTAYAGSEDFMIRQLAQITGGCVWLAFGGPYTLVSCTVYSFPFYIVVLFLPSVELLWSLLLVCVCIRVQKDNGLCVPCLAVRQRGGLFSWFLSYRLCQQHWQQKKSPGGLLMKPRMITAGCFSIF